MSSDSFNWLLVRLKSGGCDVVHLRSVVGPSDKEPQFGDVITVTRRGEPEIATLIGRAQERYMLEAGPSRRYEAGPSSSQKTFPNIKYEEEEDSDTLDVVGEESVKEEAGPSCKNEAGSSKSYEEAEDYSCSGSSWVPSADEDISVDSDTEATPVKMSPQPSNNTRAGRNNRKRSYLRSLNLVRMTEIGQLLADSAKRENGEESQDEAETEAKMKQAMEVYDRAISLLDELKWHIAKKQESKEYTFVDVLLKAAEEINRTEQSVEEDMTEYGEENNENENQNNSNDNILVTNNRHNVAETNGRPEDDWIPIGSGKTLVHKDKFKRVNWKSFTIATRTLLLAVFPRRILATHCLTGKSSPAFKNRAPKMCLDPKIISDVIIEIMDRFDVRENLVRSVITTKCADECKMLKMRTKKTEPKNDENMPPDANNNSDKENENQEE